MRIEPSGRPFLTVVVPAFNEERRLGATLERVAGWLLDRGEPAGVFYAVVGVLALSILTVLRLPARAGSVSGQPT